MAKKAEKQSHLNQNVFAFQFLFSCLRAGEARATFAVYFVFN